MHEVDAFGEPRRKRESKKFTLVPEQIMSSSLSPRHIN